MRLFFFVTLFFVLTYTCSGQNDKSKKPVEPKKKNSVSLGINMPVGDFASTHSMGVAADYSPARHWFGIINQKKIAFTCNGGVAYYFGRKETVSAYPYNYPGYFFIHAFPGVLYNPVKNGSIILTAGPALGIYNGNTQFNIGSKLEANYYITSNIAIGPGIMLMKESGADAIWAASLKVKFDL